MKFILTIAFSLALLTLGAQEALPPSGGGLPENFAEAVSVPVEKESPLQVMIRTFDRIRLEREANATCLEGLNRQMQELVRLPSANAFASSALEIRREIEALQNNLMVERENQIAFKNDIDRYSANRQLLRQEASYLSHYLDELKLYGIEQEKAAKLMQSMQRAIAYRLEQLPPPPEFTNLLGMNFALVQAKGAAPFYVSAQVLTPEQYQATLKLLAPERDAGEISREVERVFREGVTCDEARRLALGISHLTGGRVTLPGAKEVAVLAGIGYGEHLVKAVWLQDKWSAPYEEREAMVRFGVSMNALWDPARVLLRHEASAEKSEIFGELSAAHYPCLGCIFVAPVAAGKVARLQQAEAGLGAQEENR